jgi:23S rRNA (uracil1939-C5)-methyltransferase
VSRIVELVIESIAAGGDGVGRADGLVVFVPRSAPGDSGRVRIEKSGRFARARWESLERPGPARVEPPCAHYVADRCGGCQLQHLSYDAQLEAKGDIIRDAIQRIGKRTVSRPSVRPSPKRWRYRRKLTLALRRPTLGDRWIAGLHPYDNPGRVFDLVDCPITDERVVTIWRDIRAAAGLLPAETALRGAVQLSGDAGASFLLEGGKRWSTYRDFFDAVPLLESLWWQPEDQRRRRLMARESVAASSASSIVDSGEHFGPVAVLERTEPDSGNTEASFIQVNAGVAAELHAHVVERALARRPGTLVDAYAGNGDTAEPLARAGVRVTAIELDRESALRGEQRLAAPSRMIQGRVEDVLASELPADLVILNPPRTGLNERVPAILTAGPSPNALIYVSCNPATLARDLARLPGYRIDAVAAFDMFPQTAHVETVCELVRASS